MTRYFVGRDVCGDGTIEVVEISTDEEGEMHERVVETYTGEKCVDCGKEITERDKQEFCSSVVCGECKVQHNGGLI